MTNLPKTLRDRLKNEYTLETLELVRKQGARDTTQKFLWRLHDHSLIESVLIPANPSFYGEASDRHTLCVSTQVGLRGGSVISSRMKLSNKFKRWNGGMRRKCGVRNAERGMKKMTQTAKLLHTPHSALRA